MPASVVDDVNVSSRPMPTLQVRQWRLQVVRSIQDLTACLQRHVTESALRGAIESGVSLNLGLVIEQNVASGQRVRCVIRFPAGGKGLEFSIYANFYRIPGKRKLFSVKRYLLMYSSAEGEEQIKDRDLDDLWAAIFFFTEQLFVHKILPYQVVREWAAATTQHLIDIDMPQR